MKIHLLSDLHQEFAPFELTNPGADILALSGDIILAERFLRKEMSPYQHLTTTWKEWFETACAQYDRVFYVLGNHEHYNGNFTETQQTLKKNLGHIKNLVILDNESELYKGYRIVGTTLWTDFDGDNMKAMQVKNGLNDYRLITMNRGRFFPANAAEYFLQALETIEEACKKSNKVLVFGHHAPSYRSVTPEYRDGPYAYLNPGFASHLDEFIEKHPQIKLWTHGHVHSSHDYEIGSTRIVANPRGYVLRGASVPENVDFNPAFVLDV